MRVKVPVTNLYQNKFPDWSEIEFFNIIRLYGKQKYSHKKRSNKESIFIGEGSCDLCWDDNKSKLKYGNHFNNEANTLDIINTSEQSIAVIVGGNWGNQTGNSGVFKMKWSEKPRNIGDPTDYSRNTDFDNHYHDCDEYWIITRGSADVYSEGKPYHIVEGDCLITRAGDHHDIVNIENCLEGIYFETTLKGEKKLGHLWEHTHK